MRRSEMLSVVYGKRDFFKRFSGAPSASEMRRVRRNRTRRVEGEFGPSLQIWRSWQQTSQFMARRPFSPGTVAGGSLPALAPWLFGGLPTRTHFATSYARGSPASRRAGWRGTPSRSHCFSQTRTVRQSRKEPAASVPTPPPPRASRRSPRLEPAQSAHHNIAA
jgi:hypothetical protein